MTRIPAPAALGPGGTFRLDLLRVFLVAQVVLGHLAMLAFPPFAQLDPGRADQLFAALYRLATQFGPQAAVVFVAMSGFFLVPQLAAIARSPEGGRELAAFLTMRLRRIYPTLVAAIALTALCNLLLAELLHGQPFVPAATAADQLGDASWHVALANLLSLQPTFAPSFGSNGPLWAVGYIVQFYVSGALLAAAWRKSPGMALVLGAGLAGASLAWRPEWLVYFLTWVGCGLLADWRVHGGYAIAIALAAAALLFISAETLPQIPAAIVAALASLPLLVGLASHWPGDRRRRRALPLLLREATFPLYAFHFPLAVLMAVLLLPWRAAAPASFTFAWPVVALAVVLPLAFGWQVLLARLSGRGAA